MAVIGAVDAVAEAKDVASCAGEKDSGLHPFLDAMFTSFSGLGLSQMYHNSSHSGSVSQTTIDIMCFFRTLQWRPCFEKGQRYPQQF